MTSSSQQHIDQMISDIKDRNQELKDTCNLIISRMADQWVLALEDGSVLHSTGVHPFPVTFGDKVQMTRDKAKIRELLDHVRKQNPDNPTVQSLRITTLKKAARKQLQNVRDMEAFLGGRKS